MTWTRTERGEAVAVSFQETIPHSVVIGAPGETFKNKVPYSGRAYVEMDY
jgi:hypothetical protein